MRTRLRQLPAALPRALLFRAAAALVLVAGLAAALRGQGPTPPAPLQLLARDVRRNVPTTIVRGQEYFALEDLSPPFQLSVREEAGGLTVTVGARTIVLTPDQPLASVSGRLVSLPGPPVRSGRQWLVPLEFVSRALGPALGIPIDLRRASRLLVVGDLRVPRVVVRHDDSAAQARITIDVTPAAVATVTQEPGRLLVRIDADAIDATVPPHAPTPLVESIQRVATPPALAVQTGSRFASYRASTAPTDGGSRVTLDLLAQGATAAAPAPGSTASPAPGSPAPAPPPPELAPAAGGLRTVAIDPGHGGEDAGVRGPGGTIEKDLTLDLARRLKTALETRLGVRVVLTREDDRAIGLDERTAIANNSRADLLLSLHANGSPQPAAHGAAVFYLSANSGSGAIPSGLEVHEWIVPALGGAPRAIDLVAWEAAQFGHLDASARLATTIEQALRGRVELAARPVQQAPLRVLLGAHMPAVLLETGYLTNPNQEKRLAGDEYRNLLVQALVDAVVGFRDRPAPAPAPSGAPALPDTTARPPAAGGPGR